MRNGIKTCSSSASKCTFLPVKNFLVNDTKCMRAETHSVRSVKEKTDTLRQTRSELTRLNQNQANCLVNEELVIHGMA